MTCLCDLQTPFGKPVEPEEQIIKIVEFGSVDGNLKL